MKKLKTFFYSLKRSLTDVGYYQEIAKTKFSFSLKYLFLLLIFTSIFTSVGIAFSIGKIIPKVPDFVARSKTVVNNFYPSQLEIAITDGAVSTNVPEPYFFNVPKEFAKENPNNMRLITIDTAAKVEDIKKYHTLILVTKNAVVYPDKNDQYKISFLSNVPNTKINKTIYDQFAAKILSYSKYIVPMLRLTAILSLIILPFVFGLGSLIGRLVYLVFVTIPFFLLAWILKKGLSYGKVYQLSMHGLTVAVVLEIIVEVIRRLVYISETSAVYNIPWISFFIFMIIVISKFKGAVKKESA